MSKSSFIKILLIILFINALPALATTSECRINGRFQQIVFDIFGPRWALDQTSFGLALFDKRSGKLLCEEYVRPRKVIYPASTIKTLIAFAMLKAIEQGKFKLETKIKITQVNAAAECKKWDCDHYGPGKIVSVEKLLWDTITISNNLSTNQLIDLLDREKISQLAAQLGAPSLKVKRKVYDDVNPEPHLTERSQADSQGLVALYREIATGRLKFLREDLRLYMVELLGHQRYHSSLNAQFPSQVTFYHKTGNTSQVTGDGGFYYLDKDTVVVLVGLQDFNRYRVCHGNNHCFWRRGFWSLSEIGWRSYQMLEDDRDPPAYFQ